MFVGRVVVDDGVDRHSHRHLRLGGVEEADELLVPVARHVAADDGAVEHIEGGKQRRCAMDRHPDRGGELSTSRARRSRAGKHPIEKPHPTIADPAELSNVADGRQKAEASIKTTPDHPTRQTGEFYFAIIGEIPRAIDNIQPGLQRHPCHCCFAWNKLIDMPGKSSPSDRETGPIGRNQRDLV